MLLGRRNGSALKGNEVCLLLFWFFFSAVVVLNLSLELQTELSPAAGTELKCFLQCHCCKWKTNTADLLFSLIKLLKFIFQWSREKFCKNNACFLLQSMCYTELTPYF